MADFRDPEKEATSSSPASTMAALQENGIENDKELRSDDHSVSHSSSRTSHESNDSDPLEPLENALSHPDGPPPELSRFRTGTSVGTTGSRPPDFEVDFGPDDPENPKNWPLWYKGVVVFAMSFATWTTVLYSTSYTSAMPGMMKDFDVHSEPVVTLGVTTYLFGLACGSLILAPLSEIYGRRPVYIGSLIVFTLLVLPCALATSLSEVIIVRFFGAVAGSCMVSNAPGSLSDISSDANRALVFSIWSIGPMNGPVTGPLIGGFAYQYLGWRWTNWLVLILSGAAWLIVLFIKETYAPAILKRRVAKLRKETDDDRWWCRYDVKTSFWATLKINLSRPFILTFTEPILWFWDLYISVIYGILYLCFVAYPLIFTGIRGWSPGISGLAFVGVGTGTMLAIISEPLIRRMINAHKVDPETGKVPPEAAVSAVCIAAILAPVGQLIFSWTSAPKTIHWVWSILAGIPFGAGNTLIFIYSSNYIAGSYGIYAASALAGNAVIRSIFGGTLPLAGPAMYNAMTPQWAGTFLGLLEVCLIPIPFVFYKWGATIRMKSPLIKSMRADQAKMEKRANRREKRQAREDAEPEVEREDAVVVDDEKTDVKA